jgi:prolyl 4-hydroxylase
MIYLNDVEEGGETNFPLLNMCFKAEKGKAIIWNNLDETYKPNYNTLHEGTPIIKGTKIIITKWFRRPLNKINEVTYNKTFVVEKCPVEIFEKIKKFYDNNKDNVEKYVPEQVTGFVINVNDNLPSSLMILPDDLKKEIHIALKEHHERVFETNIIPTYVYGIRKYFRGTYLVEHVDRPVSHIISSIINVDQNADEPWPLKIYDSDNKEHDILLNPGEILYYASNDLKHGRPTPFKGEYFCNIMVHYGLDN